MATKKILLTDRFDMMFKEGEKEQFLKIAWQKGFRGLGQYIRYLLCKDNQIEYKELF